MIKVEDLKIGTKVRCVNGFGWGSFNTGDILTVTGFNNIGKGFNNIGIYLDYKTVSSSYFCDFELVEDKSKWHKHHDIIVAWAKGKSVQYDFNDHGWKDFNTANETPGFNNINTKWRIKPEKSEKDIQIENLEKQSKELVDMQKELADKIAKLKED